MSGKQLCRWSVYCTSTRTWVQIPGTHRESQTRHNQLWRARGRRTTSAKSVSSTVSVSTLWKWRTNKEDIQHQPLTSTCMCSHTEKYRDRETETQKVEHMHTECILGPVICIRGPNLMTWVQSLGPMFWKIQIEKLVTIGPGLLWQDGRCDCKPSTALAQWETEARD